VGSVPLRIGVFCLWITAATLAPRAASAVTVEGDISYTSDYIYRGISESGGRSAGQIDVRATTRDGTFVGVFATTLGRTWQRSWGNTGWDYAMEGYLGHRFDLSPAWSATLTGVSYWYLKGNVPMSNDYQEFSVAVSYLDFLTVTAAAIPNAVRFNGDYRLGRYPAYVVDTSVQFPLIGRLFFTAGAGYYLTQAVSEPAAPGDHTSNAREYAFGNAGFGFQFKSLRVDAGYYVAEHRAQALFPYGRAGSRFAATVSWHF
jgi:uncharacterized protein (TIGR02001 family)